MLGSSLVVVLNSRRLAEDRGSHGAARSSEEPMAVGTWEPSEAHP